MTEIFEKKDALLVETKESYFWIFVLIYEYGRNIYF